MTGARFNPFPRVNSTYGAPMGRHGAAIDPDTAPERLAVAGPAGEYDSGGAYWGNGGREGPVWAVWERGKGREGVAYVRAHSRSGAIRAALGEGES
jgi:hypothetical protein